MEGISVFCFSNAGLQIGVIPLPYTAPRDWPPTLRGSALRLYKPTCHSVVQHLLYRRAAGGCVRWWWYGSRCYGVAWRRFYVSRC